MAAMVSPVVNSVPAGEYVPTADARIVMDIDWEGYEQLLTLRGNRSQPRIAYLDGAVEIMTTSSSHESS